MARPKKKKVLIFVILVTIVVTWSLLLYYYSPADIVHMIGVRNGYLVMFSVALLGGVSALSAGSYYFVLITLAIGGLNPFLLGLTAGIGAVFGDTLFFYLGRHGTASLGESRIARMIERLTHWLDKKPAWFLPVFIYLYTGFTLLPSDVLAVALGITHRTYKTVIIPLALGSVTHTILVALLAEQIVSFLS